MAGLFDEAGGQGDTTQSGKKQGTERPGPQPRKRRCQHPDQAWHRGRAGCGAQSGSLKTEVFQGFRHVWG